MSESSSPLLSVNNIEVIYDHVILVLKGVSLKVPEGGIVALLGANGAGKTTTLKAISNILHAERGEVTKGSIEYRGQRVDQLTPSDLVKRGVVQVMEGRRCFEHLTIEENLLTGAYTRSDGRRAVADDLERVYSYFPRLKERRYGQAGYISGGEQQMTALGRALMARPSLILLDEPSMGLAPQLVEEIFEIVKRLNEEEKVTFLLAELKTNITLIAVFTRVGDKTSRFKLQSLSRFSPFVSHAIDHRYKYAGYGYILENGRVVMDGDVKTLADNEDVKEFYLGMSGQQRKSFRDVKAYHRRKRWLA